MSAAFTEQLTASDPETLSRMGFDLVRLGFYRWLVQNGHNPEYISTPAGRHSPSLNLPVAASLEQH